MSSVGAVARLLLLLVQLLGTALAAHRLPPYVTKCPSRERSQLNACVRQQAQRALDALGSQGDKKYGIPPSDPVEFPLIETDNNGFKLKFIDMKVSTDPPQSYKVDAVDLDLEGRHLDLSYSAPALQMHAKYQTDGRILILPIKGEGDAVLRIDGYKAKFSVDFDVVKNANDGLEYIKLKNPHYDSEVSKVMYNFTNLFNGDQTLGKATNDFLNANWKDVFEETKWSTMEANKQFLVAQAQAFFDRVPNHEAFPQ